MSKEAMKLALDALVIADNIALVGVAYTPRSIEAGLLKMRNAATALREALAEQPEHHDPIGDAQDKLIAEQAAQAQQEPVAWWDAKLGVFDEKHFDQLQPLYTSPPAQRKPLTDEQIKDVAASCMWWVREQDILDDAIELARAIEAAHGIKENT